MKLYFSPGACSLSPRIVLHEAGLAFEAEKVNLSKKTTAGGQDYRSINPKGSVPALQLDDGQILTEGPAIVQYLADLVPEKQLAPAAGSMARYRLMEWLNFIASELHKGFSPLFNPEVPEQSKQMARDALATRFEIVARQLASSDYLLGAQFTVADAYLFTVLNWAGFVQLDMSRWPAIAVFQARVAARPAVHAALLEEDLIKA
ncbi:glutathione transferase GstA [Herminiimonas sp. CN]|uniref:glutathione transferase GstA n=1 Tax=Herminiimonas sp. CN TaxID=1349818 RepID=UPI00047423D1|nr:glutathione transferase GstA [Herminiimonas sp. CN]